MTAIAIIALSIATLLALWLKVELRNLSRTTLERNELAQALRELQQGDETAARH